MGIREFFNLLGLRLLFEMKKLWEFIKVILKYYLKNCRFAKIDLSLLKGYFMNSPFEISKFFLIQRGVQEIYAYGETPLTSMEKISKECAIQEKDRVLELGCGRGRACFWLREFIGCSVVGVDFVPEFIQRANRVKEHYSLKEVDFFEEDFLKTDFSPYTVIYLYGTCLQEKEIEALIKKIEKLEEGVRVITVSFPLTDYTKMKKIWLAKKFSVPFEWGEAEVFLHLLKGNGN